MQSLNGAIILSRGSVWKPHPLIDQPYLHPGYNGLAAWPEGSAWARFTDTSSTPLLADLDLEVRPDGIYPHGEPEDMDQLPAGGNFEIYLEDDAGPHQIRHGKIIRKEAFYATPPSQVAIPPLAFSDSFQRTALGRKWIPVRGRTKIYDHSSLSLPNGVAVDGAFFQESAIRFFREFTSDTIEVGIQVVNPWSAQIGKTGFIVSADINLDIGLVMMLETGFFNNRLHIGILEDPITVIDLAPTVANTVANNDYYLIRLTGTSPRIISVYKGTSLTPIATWPDTTGAIPYGKGYRHFGMNFEASLLSAGIRVTSCAARDAA